MRHFCNSKEEFQKSRWGDFWDKEKFSLCLVVTSLDFSGGGIADDADITHFLLALHTNHYVKELNVCVCLCLFVMNSTDTLWFPPQMTENHPISSNDLKHLESLTRSNINLISVDFDLLKKKNQVSVKELFCLLSLFCLFLFVRILWENQWVWFCVLCETLKTFQLTWFSGKIGIGVSGKRSTVIKLLESIEKYCEENFLFEQMKMEKSTQLILKNREMTDLDRRLFWVWIFLWLWNHMWFFGCWFLLQIYLHTHYLYGSFTQSIDIITEWYFAVYFSLSFFLSQLPSYSLLSFFTFFDIFYT